MARQARRYDIFVLLFIVGSRPVRHQVSAKFVPREVGIEYRRSYRVHRTTLVCHGRQSALALVFSICVRKRTHAQEW
jgi:hypothetical protein